MERQWGRAFHHRQQGSFSFQRRGEGGGPQSGAPVSQSAASLGQIVWAALYSPQVGPSASCGGGILPTMTSPSITFLLPLLPPLAAQLFCFPVCD